MEDFRRQEIKVAEILLGKSIRVCVEIGSLGGLITVLDCSRPRFYILSSTSFWRNSTPYCLIFCGISVMAAHHLPKVRVRVRIPHTAPYATVAQMARVPAFQAGGCGIVPRLWLQRFSCRHVNFPFNPTPCLCMDHGVHMRH